MSQFTYDFDEDIPLVVEIDDTPTEKKGWDKVSASGRVGKAFAEVSVEAQKNAFNTVFHMARHTANVLRHLRQSDRDVPVESIELEFGLEFVGEANIKIVKGSVEANLLVKIKWKQADD